ncbi:MAG TPA: host attachment protein [Nodosilinea sp.]|nr:host attachment protein [Nodosilinea sp.]
MTRFLVAVVDGAKAKFLTLEPVAAPEVESGPDLVERCELLNSAAETTEPASRSRGSGSRGHSYDDRRPNSLVEVERRFAQAIGSQLETLVSAHHLNSLVLVAEPQILGTLRDCLTGSIGRLTVQEVAKDLCRLSPRQLQDYLAQRSLLPTRQVAPGAARTRYSS